MYVYYMHKAYIDTFVVVTYSTNKSKSIAKRDFFWVKTKITWNNLKQNSTNFFELMDYLKISTQKEHTTRQEHCLNPSRFYNLYFSRFSQSYSSRGTTLLRENTFLVSTENPVKISFHFFTKNKFSKKTQVSLRSKLGESEKTDWLSRYQDKYTHTSESKPA